MKIYFAGAPAPDREDVLLKNKASNRLISFDQKSGLKIIIHKWKLSSYLSDKKDRQDTKDK